MSGSMLLGGRVGQKCPFSSLQPPLTPPPAPNDISSDTAAMRPSKENFASWAKDRKQHSGKSTAEITRITSRRSGASRALCSCHGCLSLFRGPWQPLPYCRPPSRVLSEMALMDQLHQLSEDGSSRCRMFSILGCAGFRPPTDFSRFCVSLNHPAKRRQNPHI